MGEPPAAHGALAAPYPLRYARLGGGPSSLGFFRRPFSRLRRCGGFARARPLAPGRAAPRPLCPPRPSGAPLRLSRGIASLGCAVPAAAPGLPHPGAPPRRFWGRACRRSGGLRAPPGCRPSPVAAWGASGSPPPALSRRYAPPRGARPALRAGLLVAPRPPGVWFCAPAGLLPPLAWLRCLFCSCRLGSPLPPPRPCRPRWGLAGSAVPAAGGSRPRPCRGSPLEPAASALPARRSPIIGGRLKASPWRASPGLDPPPSFFVRRA